MTIANTEMAAAWDGEEGDDWTEYADRYDATNAGHWRRFLDAGIVPAGSRVLDIGCGTGQTSRDLAAFAASVLGVDLSSRMLELARQRAAEAGLTNVEFVQGDVQVHPFEPSSFDVAISRFGAMFFNDPTAAFANVASAMRPGGSLGLLAWQPLEENEWLCKLREAMAAGRDLPAPPPSGPGPFSLSDPDTVRRLLEGAGYRDVDLTPSRVPLYLGADPDDAWTFVRALGLVRGLSQGLDADTTAEVLDNVRELLVTGASPEGVHFGSAAWLITATKA